MTPLTIPRTFPCQILPSADGAVHGRLGHHGQVRRIMCQILRGYAHAYACAYACAPCLCPMPVPAPGTLPMTIPLPMPISMPMLTLCLSLTRRRVAREEGLAHHEIPGAPRPRRAPPPVGSHDQDRAALLARQGGVAPNLEAARGGEVFVCENGGGL